MDAGEGRAGSIQRVHRPAKPSEPSIYRMAVNKNHNPNVQFSTLAHELAHLFLGHLGRDVCLRIPDRSGLKHEQCELEAESTAYLVCARNGVECKSQSYLSGYVKQDTSTQQLDFKSCGRQAKWKHFLTWPRIPMWSAPKKVTLKPWPCFLKIQLTVPASRQSMFSQAHLLSAP